MYTYIYIYIYTHICDHEQGGGHQHSAAADAAAGGLAQQMVWLATNKCWAKEALGIIGLGKHLSVVKHIFSEALRQQDAQATIRKVPFGRSHAESPRTETHHVTLRRQLPDPTRSHEEPDKEILGSTSEIPYRFATWLQTNLAATSW